MVAGRRRIPDGERRARLGRRHHLAAPGPDVVTVARDLVGLHSSDPIAVPLAAAARVAGLVPADVERALYDDRTLVRLHGMRRTLWVQARDVAAEVHAASGRALVGPERRRLEGLVAEQELADDPGAWLDAVGARTLAALEGRGEASATELRADVPDLARTLAFGEGKAWAGTVSIGTRLLFLLAIEGHIVRTRPLGTWVSSQYRYAPAAAWLGAPFPSLDPAEARAALARRWLGAFAPASLADLRWWMGWTVPQSRAALAACGAVEVDLDPAPATGFVLPDDVDPVDPPPPWVALLPAMDPTAMGWKERDWYLGPLGPELFDRNGNVGPTVWSDGRIVGGWGQGAGGEVVVGVRADVGSEATAAIEAEAARRGEWFGGTRTIPRFRTPLEKALATGTAP